MKVELKILHENCYPDYATPGSAWVDASAAARATASAAAFVDARAVASAAQNDDFIKMFCTDDK